VGSEKRLSASIELETKMTDLEINEAVARKLGWIDSDFPVKGWFKLEVQPGSWTYLDEFPAYCTDIAAAWEVVPHLPYFTLTTHGYLNMKDGLNITKWEVRSVDASDLNNIIGYQAEADTAPMAICLAFLKLDAVVKSA
jgi:hypothetical protein